MTNQSIPCRAKDKTKCPYHGAELRADQALQTGDFTAYAKAQEDMAKATKTSPEIKAFFRKKSSTVLDETTIPQITEEKILKILTSAQKGHRIAERPALATRIAGILAKPDTGMHPQHDKFDKTVEAIKEVYGEKANAFNSARNIFLHNGHLVTVTGFKKIRILDERKVQEVAVERENIKVGDILLIGKERYELVEVRDGTPGNKPHSTVDSDQSAIAVNRTVSRKPHYARAFEYPLQRNARYTILQ